MFCIHTSRRTNFRYFTRMFKILICHRVVPRGKILEGMFSLHEATRACDSPLKRRFSVKRQYICESIISRLLVEKFKEYRYYHWRGGLVLREELPDISESTISELQFEKFREYKYSLWRGGLVLREELRHLALLRVLFRSTISELCWES